MTPQESCGFELRKSSCPSWDFAPLLEMKPSTSVMSMGFFMELFMREKDLMVGDIGDASLKTGDKAVGEVFLFLTNSSMTTASPIYLKVKQIDPLHMES